MEPKTAVRPTVAAAESSIRTPRRRRGSGRRGLARFVVLRVAAGVAQLVAAVVVVFVLLRLLPADPARTYAGTDNPTALEVDATRRRLGLDAPIATQLWRFLGRLAHGDLGTSWNASSPVSGQIKTALPVTLQVIVLAFVLTLLVCIPLGLAAALRPGTRTDAVVRGYSLFAGSQPEFWWGLFAIFIGWYKLRWFPSPLGILSLSSVPPPAKTNFILIDALLDGNGSVFWDALKHLALPVLTVAFALSGPFLKLIRESALAVTNSEFMIYARATGVGRWAVRRLLLRNSLTPVITLVGLTFAGSLGGSVIIETVFSLDGIGRYVLVSTQRLDFPAIQGVVVVLTAIALATYGIIDVLYAVIDPRIKYGRTQR